MKILYCFYWKKGMALHLNKLEFQGCFELRLDHHRKPWVWVRKLSLQRMIKESPVGFRRWGWMELAQLFWRERYSKVVRAYILYILSPHGIERRLLIKQTCIYFTQRCFVPSLIEISLCSGSWEKMKMWKVYRQTDRYTDDKQQTLEVVTQVS